MEIFLSKFKSKKSVNKSSGLNVHLGNVRKFVPQDVVDSTLSLNEQYQYERNNCTKIRLTCQVNVIASNVLHNKVTEIVKDEGSENVVVLNYQENSNGIVSGVISKNNTYDFWAHNNALEATRDTQLSNSICGFNYHCGDNIFNNHLLRSNVFRPVCFNRNDADEFNTIADGLRDEVIRSSNSNKIVEQIPFPVSAGYNNNVKKVESHLYRSDDILSFANTLKTKMIKTFNGWCGFYNKTTMLTYDKKFQTPLEINKVINSVNGGDFVDLYPTRELFSFCPKYNKFRHRLEKNWNYCLTYPSSSTTEMSFIDNSVDESGHPINTLKAVYFDDNTNNDNGRNQIVIYSISKHGLSVGDYVNIYKTNNDTASLCIESAQVENVVDDYIFTVATQGERISTKWVKVDLTQQSLEVDGEIYYIQDNKFLTKGLERYYIVNGYANLDDTCQHISYKKLSGEIPCEYYVRIFSKIPNFKFASRAINEYELYKSGSTLISDYQTVQNDFESHPSNLAFAQNAYTDKVGEVVFTDDIDIQLLKDNRGRPLTSIYLTLLKNNAGYKEWYGVDGVDVDPTSEKVEYSHCFGKLNCGFMESEEALVYDDPEDVNILKMHNLDNDTSNHSGLDVNKINDNDEYSDEIVYENTKHFYGDLVVYDPMNCTEEIIQPILHRFNTAQRELNGSQYFNSYTYDEIVVDDLDDADDDLGFTVQENTVTNTDAYKEGYYYAPHYEIPIRTFSPTQTLYPTFWTIRSFVKSGDVCEIYVLNKHCLNVGDKVLLYNKAVSESFYGETIKVVSPNRFKCIFYDENGEIVNDDRIPALLLSSMDEIHQFRLFKKDNLNIPSYATLLNDGSCRYLWRDVIQNGNDQNSDIEEYPFANGALYINRYVNLFVRRQDPDGVYGLQNDSDPEGSVINSATNNDYFEEEDIKC